MTKINYHEYLASREWAIKKRAVKERGGGTCERCKKNPYAQTHHLTYARLGDEQMEDLQGLCAGCHDFLSAVSDVDPAATSVNPASLPVPENDWKLVEDFARKAEGLPFSATLLDEFNSLIQAAICLACPATASRLAVIKFEANKKFDERRRRNQGEVSAGTQFRTLSALPRPSTTLDKTLPGPVE